MPNWVMRPVLARMARTMRCSCRHEVWGKAGERVRKMGKISGMGFRVSVVVWLVPTTSFRKPYSHSPTAKIFGEGIDQDTGFQGYAPAGVLVQQPRKKPKGKELDLG